MVEDMDEGAKITTTTSKVHPPKWIVWSTRSTHAIKTQHSNLVNPVI